MALQPIITAGKCQNIQHMEILQHSITKNQINTFKTSVMKTQNYCISVNNEKSITEQSSPSNCFTFWLSRSCKRAKEEPKPKHTNT